MSELRQDRLSGQWAIIAPERGGRPRQMKEPGRDAAPLHDPACPFCPGNEANLSEIFEEVPSMAPPGWLTRVIPNRFPALSPDAPAGYRNAGIYKALGGRGLHRVIVESPHHDVDLPFMGDEAIAAVVATWQRCHRELISLPGVQAMFLFRNRGLKAGASLRHPHSQAIATHILPPRLAGIETRARTLHMQSGRCPLCEILEFELGEGSRVFLTGEHFAALVPFAATCPFEFLIVPRRHAPCFSTMSDETLSEFGPFLRETLRRLFDAAADPPYNLALEAAPRGDPTAPWQHWYIRIAPDITTPNGFDLAAGIPVNPHLPEADAEMLRNAPACWP
jgi:UDPglucose--hexose-1-phosphate uridylyltransferase